MPDAPSYKGPAEHFRQIQDESPTIASALKNIKAEYVSNPSQNGDACAAYAQMMAEIYSYKEKNGVDKTKQFVNELSHKMPKEFGEEMNIEALRFVKEYEQYKKQNPEADKSGNIARVQEDQLIKALNQQLIAHVPESLRNSSPEQLGDALTKLKQSNRIGGSKNTSNQQYMDVPPEIENRENRNRQSYSQTELRSSSDTSRGWVKR